MEKRFHRNCNNLTTSRCICVNQRKRVFRKKKNVPMISHTSFLTQLSSKCVIMCCNDMQSMQLTRAWISVESGSGSAAWHWGSKTSNLPCYSTVSGGHCFFFFLFGPPAGIHLYVLIVVCAWRALLCFNSIYRYDICTVWKCAMWRCGLRGSLGFNHSDVLLFWNYRNHVFGKTSTQ